jgi:transposase
LLEGVGATFPQLAHTWVDQGYTGSGKAWIEEHLGWTVTVVRHPPKARGEWRPHGDLNDLSTVWFEWVRLPPQRLGFRGILPRRWVVEPITASDEAQLLRTLLRENVTLTTIGQHQPQATHDPLITHNLKVAKLLNHQGSSR